MSVVPLRRFTAATTIAADLRDALLSGRFAPGTALPVGELAGRVGADAAAVREALFELEREALVVHSLHRGVEVARITADELRDIFAARRVYELAGLRALLRAGPVDVSWLAAAVERMGLAAIAGDERALVEADRAFHLAIVAAAGSRRLTRSAQAALMELRLVLAVVDHAAGDLPAVVADHQYLVEVFGRADLSESVAALEEHLARAESVCVATASAL